TAATVLVVSHDRRLLESVCTQLWVVDLSGQGEVAQVARFAGGYREWRSAVSNGWSVASALAERANQLPGQADASGPTNAPKQPKPAEKGQPDRAKGRQQRPALSKDAYRRRRQLVEEDLTRLGLRKSQLELALGDPTVQANFVELRRVSSELADVDAALGVAEDAWLTLADQAPR
ncbi:MAG: hypothetical protein ACR2H0_06125, partial [Candidatus Limnocylindrales bacterium]